MFLVFCQLSAYAQIRDSASRNKNIAASRTVFKNEDRTKNISSRTFIIPGILFTYGFIASQTKSLKNIDRSVAGNFNNSSKTKLDNYIQYAPAVATFALDFSGVKSRHDVKEKVVLYALTAAITTVFTQGLKHTISVMRPDSSARNSFPSGHTATAFAAAQFLHNEYGNQSVWYSVAGYTVAGATGFLRMYNNKHWLSDVIAGAGVGIASTQLAYLIYPVIKKMIIKNRNFSFTPLPYYSSSDAGIRIVVANNFK